MGNRWSGIPEADPRFEKSNPSKDRIAAIDGDKGGGWLGGTTRASSVHT